MNETLNNANKIAETYFAGFEEMKKEVTELKVIQSQHVLMLQNLQDLPLAISELKETLMKISMTMDTFGKQMQENKEETKERFDKVEKDLEFQSEKSNIDIIDFIKKYFMYFVLAIYIILKEVNLF